jgi:hypothetical protein
LVAMPIFLLLGFLPNWMAWFTERRRQRSLQSPERPNKKTG